jgi:ABC-type dipeptide/oligopeptide/nickel transport system permease component
MEDGFFTKYVRYCYNFLFEFELGKSARASQSVTYELAFRIHIPCSSPVCHSLVTLLVGIPAGIYAALHKGQWQDNLITVSTVILFINSQLLPCSFARTVFALKLRWLPAFGFSRPINRITSRYYRFGRRYSGGPPG